MLDLTGGDRLLIALAGLGAGLINGAAGGGTLVSFPALLAVGYPAITANMTSTVGIWSGYLGGVAGFRRELAGQRDRLRRLRIAVVGGAVAGGVLLLTTPSGAFRLLAPYLLLFSCLLFALQPPLAARLRRKGAPPGRGHGIVLQAGSFLASAYGAYFGAGLGVVLLAVLGLSLPDPLVRINGLRSALALAVNTIAMVIFVVRGELAWSAAGLLAGGALLGGYVGARIARRIPTIVLRLVVIVLGLVTAGELLAR